MKLFLWLLGIGVFIITLSFVLGMCSDTANVVQKEYAPSALLRKYEYFKDVAAQLDAKIATMGTFESRFVATRQSYGADSLNRRVWLRDDATQYNIWQSEYLGVKASYNTLAAEYNAQMAKFNWRFCNKGTLPEGAENPLPREYKPYINN